MPSFTATTANFTNSSDANFRTWGSYLAGRLLASGWVQTGDTGQINWTTVLTPAGINTFNGYEIWRMNDTLQASAPVYMKIEYGEGANVDGPAVRTRFSTGSDGAGNLTGTPSTARTAQTTANAAACIVVGSGSTNRFCFAGGFNLAANRGLCFSIERMKDATGNDTAEGVMYSAHSTGNASSIAAVQQITLWNPSVGDYGLVETNLLALFPTGNTMKTVSLTMVQPIFHNKGVYTNPQLGIVGYYTNDIAANGTFVANMYGVSHTYYALPDTCWATGAAFQGPGGGTEAVGIRYE